MLVLYRLRLIAYIAFIDRTCLFVVINEILLNVAFEKHCNFTFFTVEVMRLGSVSTSFGIAYRGEYKALIVFDC